MKIDIVVPHLSYPGLRKGLESLRRNTPKENLGKVILIDQNEVYQEVDDLVDIHVRISNQGFARACNLGIRLSDAEYVGCMNDDVEILNPKWVEGIEQTFNDYSTALCVNPSSVCDPDGRGGKAIKEGFEYKENYTDEEYDRLVNPSVIDGICMWFPIFHRARLDSLKGIIAGKAWFNEAFRYGGGEDYFLNRMAYLNGLRCLGTGKSFVWHWWHGSKSPVSGQEGAHFDDLFYKLCGIWENGIMVENPDVFGNKGNKEHQVVLRSD